MSGSKKVVLFCRKEKRACDVSALPSSTVE